MSRERDQLMCERIELTNRIGGLLASQGVRDYQPLRRNRWQALAGLLTGDGRALPPRLKAEIGRMLVRIERVLADLQVVEAERDAMLEADAAVAGSMAGLLVPVAWDRAAVRQRAVVGVSVSMLRQPPPTGGIRGPGADALAQRQHQP